MMPFVLDASIAASWAFKDENRPEAKAALARLRVDEAWAPSLWWFEVRNTLVMGERRGRISEAGTAAFLADLVGLPVTFDQTPNESRTLALAREYRLTVYDAAYLELAERAGLSLSTIDASLRTAAGAAGISVI